MQFSIRMLLAAVAVVGIGAALWVAEPSWQLGAVESLLVTWMLASAATLIVQTTGKAKAFWLGVGIQCTFPIAILMAGGISFGSSKYGLNYSQAALDDVSHGFRPVLAAWALAPVVGLLCVFTHWLFIRSAVPAEPKTDAIPRRRWPQFSLRGFLVVLTIGCLWLGWLGWTVNRAREQREAVKAIEGLGGLVWYDWQIVTLTPKSTGIDTRAKRPGPVWLRRVVGDDFFQNAEVVFVPTPGLARHQEPRLSEADILHTIPHLQRLHSLKQLKVNHRIRLSTATIDKLKAVLPYCEITATLQRE